MKNDLHDEFGNRASQIFINSNIKKLIIPRAFLFNIFQFGHPDFYGQIRIEDKNDGAIYIIRSLLNDINSPKADHFTEQAPTKDIDLYSGANQNGDILYFANYALNGQNGESLHSVMMIGQATDGPLNIKPHFIMTAENALADNIGEVLIPDEVMCRYRPEKAVNDVMGKAKNDAEIIAGICYADQAFRNIMSNNPIDTQSSQIWINPEHLTRSSKRFLSIKDRTLSGLQQELNFPPDIGSDKLDAKHTAFFIGNYASLTQ